MHNPTEVEKPLVLIADDDPLSRAMLRKAILQTGCQVIEAADGNDAVAKYNEHKPGLLILDVMMPGMDGYGVCRQVRSSESGKTIPILMLTGLDDTESINKAYQAGATDFATKPVNWLLLGQRALYMLRMGQLFNEVELSRRRLAYAQKLARMGNWEWNIATDTLHWSEEVFNLLQLDASKVVPSEEAFVNRLHPDDKEMVLAEINKVKTEHGIGETEYRVTLPDGLTRTFNTRLEAFVDDSGVITHMWGTIQDVTEKKEAENRIRFLAYYDTLTRLPNRQLFAEQLGVMLANARRHNRRIAVLYMDIDRFKYINDTLGHTTGDDLLRQVAERLKTSLRESDLIGHAAVAETDEATQKVARLGGDEFTITLAEVADNSSVAKVASRILNVVKQPFILNKHDVVVTASIGISMFPDDGEDVETLLMNADTAMYHVKDSGADNYAFFNRNMNADVAGRLDMENNLRRALERGEFKLNYQPQIDINTGKVVGAEALIRWIHPELGFIPPDKFIPLAEETGLIIPIGEWVLHEACAQRCRWREAGLPELRIAVNLSARQFSDKSLLATIQNILQTTGLEPTQLELEITESAIMHNPNDAVRIMSEIKAMGMQIAIDDFGTGYSSLGYLKRFPIDVLKIDRTFIRDITTDRDDAAITAAIIALSRKLELDCIAEGVETEEHVAILRQYGCEMVQGYFFSKPLGADDFYQWYKRY